MTMTQKEYITKLRETIEEHEEYIAELEQASEQADKWIYQIADALGIPCGVGDRHVLRRIRDKVQKLQSMCNWLAKFENGSPCARGITCPYGTPSAKDPEGCNANAANGRCWQDAARHAVERMPDNGKSSFGPKMYHPS